MSLTRGEAQVLWSGNASVTLSNTTRTDSDAFVFDATDVAAVLHVSADNSGTPASGQLVRVFAKFTGGDLLGDAGDDYDTHEHALFLGVLDTFGSNVPGEDPARASFSLNEFIGAKGFRVSVEAAAGTIVVRARVSYQRAA